LSEPLSVVLTEDDYFKYLIGVTRNSSLIPKDVLGALVDSALLMLGFRMDDWQFRVLFHSLLDQQGNILRGAHPHIAAQIVPEEGRTLDPERAREYLEQYYGGAKISVLGPRFQADFSASAEYGMIFQGDSITWLRNQLLPMAEPAPVQHHLPFSTRSCALPVYYREIDRTAR
jgi:hypothetical protein